MADVGPPEGAWNEEWDPTAWAKLVEEADRFLEQHAWGNRPSSVEVVLARVVKAHDAWARRKGVSPILALPCCVFCGTSGLVHDPKCALWVNNPDEFW